MFKKLLEQFIIFSRENWWVYILLLSTLAIVVITWRWNIIEIVSIFILNLMAAMCNMLMMSSYKDKRFQEGSIFILLANLLYTCISLYAWIHDGDIQYIFWQASFILTWVQMFVFYNYNYTIKFINIYTIAFLNLVVLYSLIYIVGVEIFAIIQSFWLAILTLGLIVKNDTQRYFLILSWNNCTVIWSLLILISNYTDGNLLWVTVAYTLLGLSITMYYLKILPEYIVRIRNI